jgi:molecular chaperone DnaK (HSP70)
VLTVPAVWTAGAKDRTIQAARAAGVPESIELVTESEAGALAVLRDKAEMKDLDVRTFKFFSILGIS